MERPTVYCNYFHVANKEGLFPISDVPREFRQDKVSINTLTRLCYGEIISFVENLIAKYGDKGVVDLSGVFEKGTYTGPVSKLYFSMGCPRIECTHPDPPIAFCEYRYLEIKDPVRDNLQEDVWCCQELAKHFGEEDTFSKYLEWIKLRMFDRMKTIITENAADGFCLDVSDLHFPSLPVYGVAKRMEYLPSGSEEGENIRAVFLMDTDYEGEWSEVFYEYFSDMEYGEMVALCNVIERRYIANRQKRFCRRYPYHIPIPKEEEWEDEWIDFRDVG